MNKFIQTIVVVLFCVYRTNAAIATPCDTVRSDIQALQDAARQAEVTRIQGGFSSVSSSSDMVKRACLDNIASFDLSSAGLNPAITQILIAAANKFCDQASSQVQQQTNNSSSALRTDKGQVTSASGQTTSASGQGADGANQSSASPDTSIWEKMKNMLRP